MNGLLVSLGLQDIKTIEDIPAAKRSFIIAKAKREGKLPIMVFAGIKACLKRRANGTVRTRGVATPKRVRQNGESTVTVSCKCGRDIKITY